MTALCPVCDAERAMRGLTRPKRGHIKARLLAYIECAGPQGLTVDDLERLTKLGHQSVSARVHELKAGGCIVAAGKRTNPSGKPATTWRALGADEVTGLLR